MGDDYSLPMDEENLEDPFAKDQEDDSGEDAVSGEGLNLYEEEESDEEDEFIKNFTSIQYEDRS